MACAYLAMAIAFVHLAAASAAEDRTGGVGLAQLIGGAPPASASAYGLPPQQQQPYESWPPPPPNDIDQPQGFTVQSGYSGLVVPEAALAAEGDSASALHRLGGVALGASLLSHLLPFPFNKIALFLGSKLGLWALGVAALLLLGGAATTALCAFTPVCTISFLGFRALSRETTRAFLTKDRLEAATRFARDAVAKWTELQRRADAEDEAAGRDARKRKKVARSQRERAAPDAPAAAPTAAPANATAAST